MLAAKLEPSPQTCSERQQPLREKNERISSLLQQYHRNLSRCSLYKDVYNSDESEYVIEKVKLLIDNPEKS
jgi:hypothetical protein